MHSSEHAEGPGQSANFSQVAGKLDCRDSIYSSHKPVKSSLGEGEKMLRVAIGGMGVEKNSGS